MMGALEAWRLLRSLPDQKALKVLDLLSRDLVYEAERIVHTMWGPDRADQADELIASLVRARITGQMFGEIVP